MVGEWETNTLKERKYDTMSARPYQEELRQNVQRSILELTECIKNFVPVFPTPAQHTYTHFYLGYIIFA